MKKVLRFITFIVILASLYALIPAYYAFKSITEDPEAWMGGISAETTIVWFALIFLGFGYLAFATLLALMGCLFGHSKRKAAFWLLKLPGILGVLLCVLLFTAFYLWDIDWISHVKVVVVLFLPFLIYFFYGNTIRKSHPKNVPQNANTN